MNRPSRKTESEATPLPHVETRAFPMGNRACQELLEQGNRQRLLKARMTLLAAEAGMIGLIFQHRHGDESRPITPLTVETAGINLRLAQGPAA